MRITYVPSLCLPKGQLVGAVAGPLFWNWRVLHPLLEVILCQGHTIWPHHNEELLCISPKVQRTLEFFSFEDCALDVRLQCSDECSFEHICVRIII